MVELITKHKKKQIEVLGADKDPESRYEVFYKLIADGKISTDDAAARHFFGEDKDGTFTQYRNFRNQFFKRLVNSAFFIDLKKPMFNNAQAAAHNVRKNAAAARMLASRGARHVAFEIAEKTISAAEKYEMTYELLDLARLLRHKYAYVCPDTKKWAYYEDLIDKCVNDLAYIEKAEKCYYRVINPYVNSRASQPKVNEKARKYLAELEEDLGDCDAFWFRFLYYSIWKLESLGSHDWERVVEKGKEALHFLEKSSSAVLPMKASFLNMLVIAYTMLRRYEEAEATLRQSEGLTRPGTHNWFKGREQGVVLYLHQQDYAKAYEMFDEVKRNKRFPHLAPMDIEIWTILEAHLQLLHALGKIEVSSAGQKRLKLRPGKLLNDIPHFSKDKRGLNIPVLIVHAIMLLQLGRYDEAYDRMLALDKYACRHLKAGEDTFRSYCFIKALLCIPAAKYRRDAAQLAAAEHLQAMAKEEIQLVHTPHEVEVMPYEHLWDMAMEALEAKA